MVPMLLLFKIILMCMSYNKLGTMNIVSVTSPLRLKLGNQCEYTDTTEHFRWHLGFVTLNIYTKVMSMTCMNSSCKLPQRKRHEPWNEVIVVFSKLFTYIWSSMYIPPFLPSKKVAFLHYTGIFSMLLFAFRMLFWLIFERWSLYRPCKNDYKLYPEI